MLGIFPPFIGCMTNMVVPLSLVRNTYFLIIRLFMCVSEFSMTDKAYFSCKLSVASRESQC